MVNEREAREAMALTCGMISMIDDAVGAIIEKLRETGRYENTVIIFNADHGDYLGDCGLLLKGAVMRRSINNVPFIWSDPNDRAAAGSGAKVSGAKVSGALASTVDLAPSILERAGVEPYYGIQGRSFIGCLEGSAALRDQLVIEHEDTQTRAGFQKPAVARTLLTRTRRLTIYRGETWGELYDLEADPLEMNNRWDDSEYAAERARLTEALMREMLDNVDASPRARRRA